MPLHPKPATLCQPAPALLALAAHPSLCRAAAAPAGTRTLGRRGPTMPSATAARRGTPPRAGCTTRGCCGARGPRGDPAPGQTRPPCRPVARRGRPLPPWRRPRPRRRRAAAAGAASGARARQRGRRRQALPRLAGERGGGVEHHTTKASTAFSREGSQLQSFHGHGPAPRCRRARRRSPTTATGTAIAAAAAPPRPSPASSPPPPSEPGYSGRPARRRCTSSTSCATHTSAVLLARQALSTMWSHSRVVLSRYWGGRGAGRGWGVGAERASFSCACGRGAPVP
jgi:hypothetical protein